MAEINAPAWLQGGSHTAQGDRAVLSGLYGHATPGGVLEGFAVSPGTTGLSVTVAPGVAVVPNPAPWGGPYNVGSDSDVAVTVPAADPGNPRVDLVVAQVHDSAYAGADDRWELEVVSGAAGSAPVAPATPDRALVLAQVSVPAGATTLSAGDVTDQRTTPATVGGALQAYVKLSGGTMAGPLSVLPPTANAHAVNRGWAEGRYAKTLFEGTASAFRKQDFSWESGYAHLRIAVAGQINENSAERVAFRFNGIGSADYYTWSHGHDETGVVAAVLNASPTTGGLTTVKGGWFFSMNMNVDVTPSRHIVWTGLMASRSGDSATLTGPFGGWLQDAGKTSINQFQLDVTSGANLSSTEFNAVRIHVVGYPDG